MRSRRRSASTRVATSTPGRQRFRARVRPRLHRSPISRLDPLPIRRASGGRLWRGRPLDSPAVSTTAVSQPRYEVERRLDVRVPVRDGLELSANLWLPVAVDQHPAERFPAILEMIPYGKDNWRSNAD